MDNGKYNAHHGSREHLHGHWYIQGTSWKQGAPTWTLVSTLHWKQGALVSTRHLLEAGSTYMDTGKYTALEAGSTYMDTGKY